MKNKCFFSIITVMLSFITYSAMAQSGVIVQYTTNQEQAFILNDQGKIYFYGSNLIIDQSNGQTQTIEISNIRKLYFQTNLSISEDIAVDNNIILYPNPATDQIKLSNIKVHTLISVYSMDGKLLINQFSSSDKSINVGNLQKGLYIVKANDKTFKLIKQ
ncbi:MAG: T9SS type A sorting domain-containing protein [Bacteroidales bacterium]